MLNATDIYEKGFLNENDGGGGGGGGSGSGSRGWVGG